MLLTFKYTARDSASGKRIKAEVQAESEQAAAKLIHEQGLSPIDIRLKDGDGESGLGRYFNRIRAKDKILFSRQLSTLINAGLPLLQSLRSVEEQTQSKPLKAIISYVITEVEAGSALSAAMERHPRVFNQIYVSLIAAGEASGTLDDSLERIANQQEKDAEILSKVRGALIYPLIVILVMFAVVGFMIVQVLPQVEVLYEGIPGARLPLLTRILLAISDFAVKFWWVAIGLFTFGGFMASRWARTLGGKVVIDKLKMKMWPVGPLFMKMYMARFARTGTTLVASGVPLIQILEITSKSINNIHIEKTLHMAIDKVRGGSTLSKALKNQSTFLPLVPDMLSIGEQSGAIEEMLAKIAEYFEKEVDDQIKTISTIIEPLLMVILGIMAFIIVAAVLLPIYGLAGTNIGT